MPAEVKSLITPKRPWGPWRRFFTALGITFGVVIVLLLNYFIWIASHSGLQ
jgi:hypothetical protein